MIVLQWMFFGKGLKEKSTLLFKLYSTERLLVSIVLGPSITPIYLLIRRTFLLYYQCICRRELMLSYCFIVKDSRGNDLS